MAAAAFRALFGLGLLAASCTSIAADQRTFDGTLWRVASINGQATPATGNYQLNFSAGQVAGSFGCNGFGGRYSVAGATIEVRQLRSTLRACTEPAASFEGEGLAIINQPMRMNWANSSRLALGNGAGTIALERLP